MRENRQAEHLFIVFIYNGRALVQQIGVFVCLYMLLLYFDLPLLHVATCFSSFSVVPVDDSYFISLAFFSVFLILFP